METFFNKDTLDKIKNFLIDNKRYIAAIILFVILVVVLACCTGEKANKAVNTETENASVVNSDEFVFDDEFQKDSDASIKELLEQYYAAYANGDAEELEKVAMPISDNEKSYINVLSKYYEEVMNISYYSKSGANEGSYFVSVRNDIKFYDVEATAPALDFFYIETGDDGKLFINNLYSIYNLTFAENVMDSDIYTLIQQYMQQADFEKLQKEVQVAYDEALTGDEALSKMLGETLDQAIREWASNIRAAQEENESVETTESSEATEATDDANQTDDANAQENTDANQNDDANTQENTDANQNDDAAQNTTQTTSKVKTLDIVNVRASASADSELLGKLTDGVILTKLGEEGEWTIVEYSGGKDGKGYIKTEFLEAVK